MLVILLIVIVPAGLYLLARLWLWERRQVVIGLRTFDRSTDLCDLKTFKEKMKLSPSAWAVFLMHESTLCPSLVRANACRLLEDLNRNSEIYMGTILDEAIELNRPKVFLHMAKALGTPAIQIESKAKHACDIHPRSKAWGDIQRYLSQLKRDHEFSQKAKLTS